MAAWFVMVKSSWRLWARLSRETASSFPLSMSFLFRTEMRISKSPSRSKISWAVRTGRKTMSSMSIPPGLPRGVGFPEEFALHGPPEHAAAPPGVPARLAEERADLHVQVPDILEGGRDAEDGDVARPVPGPDLRRAEDHRRDASEQVSLLLQG